ncbi:MAG: carboxypeptidase regulatory-like domain-containing protein, partial [Acidobacteriota bacterium]
MTPPTTLRRLFVVLVLPRLACLGGPALAAEDAIGNARLQISGTRLVVGPVDQTVPFDTATVVTTELEGYDPALGTLPPEMRVLGDFVGPEIGGVLTLQATPGEPFRIPRLRVEGHYRLENIRLVLDDEILAYAEPRDTNILVTQILLTSVSSRALTLEEIRAYGLVIDENNFGAINLTFAYGVAGKTFNYNLPLVYDLFGPDVDLLPNPDAFRLPEYDAGHRTVKERFKVPRVVPFSVELLKPEPPEIPSGGCDPRSECRPELRLQRPLVGVILFPTEVSLLHQFFSVVLQVENGAPEGDPAQLRNLFANVELPPGLRIGETEPPTIVGDPVPVKDPGPDGEMGTADDRNFIIAGARGSAEVLLEGTKHGTHIVNFDISGVLDGLPTGPRAVTGSAQGAVSVRDPRLQAHIAHPQTVRANVDYSVYLTVSNVGSAPVNLISLELPPHALSGVTVVGPNQQSIPKLDPGESETVEFRVESLRTGRVVSSSLRMGSSIEPSFEWSIGVNDDGALSGDSLLLPRPAEALPSELNKQALALVGIGYSLAQAPPSFNSGLPRVSEEAVNERVYRLGQVGRHIDYGESLFDTMAVMSAEWLGVRDGDWEWDQLRRESRNGDKLSAEIGALLESESSGVLDAFERYAATTHFLGLQAAAVTGAGLRLELTSRTSGKRVARSALHPDRLRDLPFAGLYDFADGDLGVLAQPEEAGHTAFLMSDGGGTGGLHVLIPGASGDLRTARFLNITLGAGGVARVDFAASDASFVLEIDADGDGVFESSRPAVMDLIPRRPFEVISAVQNDQIDSSGHVVDVLFTEDVSLEYLVPRDPARFELPDNLSNGGLVPTEEDLVTSRLTGSQVFDNPFDGLNNPRVVKVIFENPVSPLLVNTLSVSDLWNVRDEEISPQNVEIETRTEQQGARVEGTVYGSDGRPLVGATVVLYEHDRSGFGNDYECIEHATAQTTTDAQGRYHFDWVRQTDCGDIFRVFAQDTATAEFGDVRGRVRLIGQTQELNLALPGRGRVTGRVTYDDGTVPEALHVVVHNPEWNAGRLAHIGADGRFDVEAIIVGQVTLAADDGRGHFAYATFEMPNAGADVVQDVTIVRRPPVPPGGVRGVVRLASDDSPIEGAYLALYIDNIFTASVRSGADGRFDFGTVPSGVAEIEVFTEGSTHSGRGAGQLFFEVLPDRTEDVEVRVQESQGTVQGRVYRRSLAGQLTPVSGAVVYAEGTPLHATTDVNGSYTLDGVFQGQWTVRAVILDTGETVTDQVDVTSAGGVVDRDLFFDELLPQGGLVGTVLDYDGHPAANALVHLSGGYYSTRWHHEVYSDEDGRFTIEDLDVGTYGVHAMRGDDGGLGWGEIRFPGETAHVTVRFQKGTIKGQTLAPAGEDGSLVGVVSQIAFRKVEVYSEWSLVVVPPDFTYIETDPNGRFEIEALAGPYELHIFNAFHGTDAATNQIDYHGQIVEHEFIFQPNGDIRGTVYDIDGVTPVVGARVNLSGGSFAAYDVHTDEDGRYHFPLVPPGGYQVQAFHTEGVVYRQTQVYASLSKPGQQMDGVDIELPLQGTLTGWVEDADGYPVPGAVVTLQESVYPWRKIVQNADEEGNYAFENVFGGGPVTLYGEAPSLGGLGSRVQAEVHFEAQDVMRVITLEPTGDIEGLVLNPDGLLPVAGASVELSRGDVFEDATSSADDGTFVFNQLPLGWYRAVVFEPATGRRGQSEWVELTAHHDVGVADVELESRGVVTGRFMDADVDSPLPGHVVQMRNARWYTVYATTDINGYFEFGGVPEGDFRLIARDSAKRRMAQAHDQILFEDQIVEANLTLAPFSEVSGRVHNPPGAPAGLAEHVNVRVEQSGRVVAAGFDNPFLFDGIEPRRKFTIVATDNGGLRRARASGRISEEGQDLDFDLTFQALGEVTVTVTDSFGQPVDGASVYVSNQHEFGYESFSASTGADHEVVFADVLEGRVTARATHPNGLIKGSISGDLTLDGENLVLAVVLQDTGTVRGRALMPDGVTPAADAVVALEVNNRWLLTEAGADGAFELTSVVMGSYHLIVQEADGLGTIERFDALTANGEIRDHGDLVLDAEDPFVIDFQPPLGARDVPLNTAVTITFSEPMDVGRFTNQALLRKISGHGVGVAYGWSADGTRLTLTPTGGLVSGTGYDIFVNSSVYDLAGRDLAWRVRSHFYTADVIPPSVLRSNPRDGAVQVPEDANLLVTFTEPVVLESLSGAAIQLFDVTAGQSLTTTFQLRPGEREVLITPVAAMAPDRDIRLTIQGVRDLSGNIMPAPVEINFWTPDHTPPTGAFTAPAEGEVYTAGDVISMAVDATDNRTMGSVTFRVDQWTSVDSSSPYAGSLLAPVRAAAGDVTLTATLADAFGNTTDVTRTVRVEPYLNAQAPEVQNHCWSDGDFVQPGVQIPLQVSISDDERLESYGLYVDGALLDEVSPADVPSAEVTFYWTPPHDSPPGTAFAVKVEARDFAGNLGAATATMTVPLEVISTSDQVLNELEAGGDLVLGVGTFTLNQPLGLQSLRMLHGATLVTTTGGGFDLDVVGDVRTQCGSEIRATGLGFPGGDAGQAGGAPAWVSGSQTDAGGSHGGAGRTWDGDGAVGEIYDSVYLPTLAGAGGSEDRTPGAFGGGVVNLTVGGDAVLHGLITVRGATRSGGAGGAGGTAVVLARSIAGRGVIDARGGDGVSFLGHFSGGGGGGRIALYADTFGDFDPLHSARAWGGEKARNGSQVPRFAAPGTVFTSDAASTYGHLLVTNGRTEDGGSRRDDFVATLPTLGVAAVTGWSPAGADVWVAADRTLRARWLGAWVELLDGSGGVLGTYEVIEVSDTGDILLAGAASAGAASELRGVYRFDTAHIDDVEFKPVDPFNAAELTLDGAVQIGDIPVVQSLHLRGETYLRPAGGQTLAIEVLGPLTIDAGAVLDVTGLGYAGSSASDVPASAPDWIDGSLTHGGGSHGGRGSPVSLGPAGGIYDRVYRPRLAGGGGTFGETTGSPGGGVITLKARQLVLDGELLADAADIRGASSGAGGTVLIEADALSGSGRISAAGGDIDRGGQTFLFGNGGGGRVAYWVPDLSGWDVRAQTDVRAGVDRHSD